MPMRTPTFSLPTSSLSHVPIARNGNTDASPTFERFLQRSRNVLRKTFPYIITTLLALSSRLSLIQELSKVNYCSISGLYRLDTIHLNRTEASNAVFLMSSRSCGSPSSLLVANDSGVLPQQSLQSGSTSSVLPIFICVHPIKFAIIRLVSTWFGGR